MFYNDFLLFISHPSEFGTFMSIREPSWQERLFLNHVISDRELVGDDVFYLMYKPPDGYGKTGSTPGGGSGGRNV